MRLGIDRSVLRNEVLIEARLSTTSAHSTQHVERINHLLNRMERQLQTRYSWPQRQFEEEVVIAADANEAAIPVGMAVYTNVLEIWCLYGDEWLPMASGIGAAERSTFGPDDRDTPIRRYEAIWDSDPYAVETWPIGNVEQTIRFTGDRTAGNMVEDTDGCVLDGDVLVLETAAALIEKSDKETAATLRAQSSMRIADLLKRNRIKQPVPNLATRPGLYLPRAGVDYIPPGTPW
jgi:hypothetical protein